MNLDTINYLHDLHFITQEQKERLSQILSTDLFSLHYELRGMLSAGVLLLVSGVSMFAFNNINTTGQGIIIFMLFAMASSCLMYAFTKRSHYSHKRVTSPGIACDFMLLLGCLLFLLALGYSQYAYAPFGGQWELVGLISGLVFIPLAYRFDHRGVLSLGIVCLGLAIGLMVSPFSLLKEGFIVKDELIAVGFAFGALLLVIGWAFEFGGIKKHFTATYIHLSAHFLFVACLAGIVLEEHTLAFALLLSFLCCCGVYYARFSRSFLILLVTSLYGYIGMSYLVSRVITDATAQSMYVVISCATVIVALFTFKKRFPVE